MDEKDPLEPFYRKIDYYLDGQDIGSSFQLPPNWIDIDKLLDEVSASMGKTSMRPSLPKGGEVDILDNVPPGMAEDALVETQKELNRIMASAKAMQVKKNKYQ